MIDIKSPKCIKCKEKIPHFNLESETKALYCKNCATEDMIDIKHPKCIKCKEKQPHFNLLSETKALYCKNCATEDMIDIKHHKCKGQSGNCSIRANKKYKGYCAYCYQHEFPNDPLTFQIRCKTKEIAIRDCINANFDGFQHDSPMYTGHCDCSIKRRIDHRKLIGNTLLAIETDENQHKSYDKMDEEIRYNDLYMAYSGKWIYIRFNPDKYINKKGKNVNPMLATRLSSLIKEIDKQINRIENEENGEGVEVIYMYYDRYN